MNAHQERVQQSFRRVQGWFAANSAYTASTPALASQLEALNGVVQRLTDHAAAQDTQRAQSLLISKDEVERRRDVVLHHMAPIARLARALRGTVPGISVLTLPKGNANTPTIITAAVAMAQKAEVYKDVLIENGLPDDFLGQLKSAAAALKASLDARGLARAARVAATRGVQGEVEVGRRVVEIINVTMTRLLRSQPAKLAEWEQLKRVTVKPALVRSSATVVDIAATRVEPSSTESQSESTGGIRAA